MRFPVKTGESADEAAHCAQAVAMAITVENPSPIAADPKPITDPSDVAQKNLWSWYWQRVPSELRQYRSRLEADGYENVRALTLLTADEYKRLQISAYGHRAQIKYYAEEALK